MSSFNPKRQSITSSRYNRLFNSSLTDDPDLSDSKAMYDRQVLNVSYSKNSTPKPSETSPMNTKVGYDISGIYDTIEAQYVKSNSLCRSQTSKKLPSYIDIQAVSHGLRRKNMAYESIASVSAVTEPSLSISDDKEKLHFNFIGEIKKIEKPYFDSVEYTPDLSPEASVLVNQSEIMFKVSDLWSWPWLDPSITSQILYKCDNVGIKSLADMTKELPRWECPHAAHTFKRYLESVEPCVSKSQFEQTKEIMERFASDEGKHLHEKLMSISDSEDDWIPRILHNYNFCYSTQEAPLLNLGIIAPFCHDVWPEKENSMLERAVVVIRLVTEFWNLIRTETLKPVHDHNGNVINCLQFLELFSTTTLPGIPNAVKYRFMKTENEGKTACYITISYRGYLFIMDIVDSDYRPLPLMDIANSLHGLMEFVDLGIKEPKDGVALMTSANLTTWSQERMRLMTIGNNMESFSALEHAIFSLSLDHMNVSTLDQLASEAIFADGCNRWYDKALTFYIHSNGFVTVNVNSKILDGSTVAFLLHYMHLRILEESQMWEDELEHCDLNKSFMDLRKDIYPNKGESKEQTGSRKQSLLNTELRMLDFSLDEIAEEKIRECVILFSALSAGVLTATCKLDHFDTALLSANSIICKDAFVIMALHLTFFRMYYRPASVGCKVSVKKFSNTRYDIMRATTRQVVDWCRSFGDNDVSDKTKQELFWGAHKKLMRLLKECYGGRGCDNHLNALRNLSDQEGVASDNNVFEDDGFFLSGGGDRYEILTESLGVGCTSCPVFLPCNPKGYGVGYCAATSFLLFTVTSWKEETVACAPLFASCLNQTCKDLLSSLAAINTDINC